MMKISTNSGQPSHFWIARLGSQAGKPLRKPYTSTNSFVVYSDDVDHDFACMMCLYLSGEYRPHFVGTCFDTLRLRDVQNVAKLAALLDPVLVTKVNESLVMVATMELQIAKSRLLIKQLAQAAVAKAKE